jgi:hypothetical protein
MFNCVTASRQGVVWWFGLDDDRDKQHLPPLKRPHWLAFGMSTTGVS